MNKFYLALATLFFCQAVLSQDIIVTQDNDTIQALIIKQKKEEIYFVFKNKGRYQSSMLPMSEVKSFQKDFNPKIRIPKDSLPGYIPASGFRLAINGGYSYDPARISPSIPTFLRDYNNKLRSGYHIETSAIYFFDRTFGIGIKYNLFKSKNSMDNINFTDIDGMEINGTLENDITTSFVGLVLATRIMGKKSNNAVFINSAFGYLSYRDDQLRVDPFMFTGNTLGSSVDVGYDYEISEDFFVGAQVGITGGRLKKVEMESASGVETVELSDNERPWGSARIDFSVGVRFQL
ncbi:hypothetical protein [Flagellimonas myxillae]|uniref:hypothetical protein n=1 Tax=Flagellimonas myxillae TaxID=2942214 RepID=UPI00201F3DF4|nr:hypothetical protein [Muricauda myxillae]MCL6268003.1 hypothetical protein [Muricauda myxillae]